MFKEMWERITHQVKPLPSFMWSQLGGGELGLEGFPCLRVSQVTSPAPQLIGEPSLLLLYFWNKLPCLLGALNSLCTQGCLRLLPAECWDYSLEEWSTMPGDEAREALCQLSLTPDPTLLTPHLNLSSCSFKLLATISPGAISSFINLGPFPLKGKHNCFPAPHPAFG